MGKSIPSLDAFADAPWIAHAYKDLGLKEIPGKGSSGRIDKMFDTVGYPDLDDADSWCGAFSGNNLIETGEALGVSIPPPLKCISGKMWETWGIKLDKPKLGCFCTSTYTKLGVKDWRRHIGMVVEIDNAGKRVRLLGGNQANQVSDTHWVPMSKVTAYRWPIRATKKDLKAAGSTELKIADAIRNVSLLSPVVAGGAAGAKDMANAPVVIPEPVLAAPLPSTPPPIDAPLPPVDPSIWQQMADYQEKIGIVHTFSEGIAGLYGVLTNNIWLVGVLALSLGGFYLASKLTKNRIAKHEAGIPLSMEVV